MNPRLTYPARSLLFDMLRLWKYESVKPVYDKALQIANSQNLPVITRAVLSLAVHLQARGGVYA